MAAEGQVNQMSPTCMESVNRFAKFPVIETTLQTATNIYEIVKDYNSVTQWTCSTAESAVGAGKTIVTPIVQGLEGPIKKVDGVLCTGLDYVEEKVPAIKLPPSEIIYQIYNTTKDYMTNTVNPAVKSAYGKIEPAIESAKTVVEPAVVQARHLVEPAVEKAMPYVQPALDKAQALKDYGTHKIEEFLAANRCNHESPEENDECPECREAARRTEENHHSHTE